MLSQIKKTFFQMFGQVEFFLNVGILCYFMWIKSHRYISEIKIYVLHFGTILDHVRFYFDYF